MDKAKSQFSISTLFLGDLYDLFVLRNTSDWEKPKKDSLIEMLRRRQYPVELTSQSYRVINTWEGLGLLDMTRENDRKWRRFNSLELVWIRIAAKLRSFGFPIQKLQITRQSLFYSPHFPDRRPEFYLDFAIWHVLSLNKFIKLLVFPDGEAHLLRETDMILNRDDKEDFIQLDFTNIVKETFGKPELKTNHDRIAKLSDSEFDVLEVIRSGNYSKVEIVPKDGKIERYSATEQVDASKRIGDLLRNREGFDVISVWQRADGKVVSIKRTIKKIVK